MFNLGELPGSIPAADTEEAEDRLKAPKFITIIKPNAAPAIAEGSSTSAEPSSRREGYVHSLSITASRDHSLALKDAPIALLLQHNSSAPVSPKDDTDISGIIKDSSIAKTKARGFHRAGYKTIEQEVGTVNNENYLVKPGLYSQLIKATIKETCGKYDLETRLGQVKAVVMDGNLHLPSECPLKADLEENLHFLLAYFPQAKFMFYSGGAQTSFEAKGKVITRKLSEVYGELIASMPEAKYRVAYTDKTNLSESIRAFFGLPSGSPVKRRVHTLTGSCTPSAGAGKPTCGMTEAGSQQSKAVVHASSPEIMEPAPVSVAEKTPATSMPTVPVEITNSSAAVAGPVEIANSSAAIAGPMTNGPVDVPGTLRQSSLTWLWTKCCPCFTSSEAVVS